jgi:hypothetical protein
MNFINKLFGKNIKNTKINPVDFINQAPEMNFPPHWKIQPQPAGSEKFKDSIFEFSVKSKKSKNPEVKISVFLRVSNNNTLYWITVGGGLEGIGSFCNNYKNSDFYKEVANGDTYSQEIAFPLNETEEMLEAMENCFNNHPTDAESSSWE